MSAASMPPGHDKHGFTLIELMIVIGIITVLASILVPVVSRSRKSSMGVVCAANLRQLTAAALMYATENDGQLPNPNWNPTVDVSSSTCYGVGWLYALLDYRAGVSWLGLAHLPEDGVKTGVLWPYLQTLKVYHCPMDDPDFRVGTEWLTSYLMNPSPCGFGRYGSLQFCPPFPPSTINVPAVHLSSMKAPSESVMLWEGLEQRYQNESNTGDIWNDGSSYPTEEVMADRHSKGANLSCYDGHVEWWDNGTWKKWVNQPGIGRLWCDPLTPDGR